jgi:hypothetical protein
LVLVAGLLAAPVAAVTVPKGTAVDLVFDQALSSKTAVAGEKVRLHVINDVMVGGTTVIKAGAPVTGVLTQVKHHQRWGVNAKIMIALRSVKSTFGTRIPLNHRQKGQAFGGKKSTEAAGATVGGAILLGPVGLVGGYFITGKNVNIKAGDPLPTEVAKTIVLGHRKK